MANRLRFFLPILLLGTWSAFAGTLEQRGDDFGGARRRMVQEQLRARGVEDRRVLSAMEQVPRHLFVPEEVRDRAYSDHPLPIGEGQTISQPYIVGLMTQLLGVKPGDKILEIGTGSGYQAAVLSRVASEVYTIEIVKPLGEQAERTLSRLGYSNIHTRIGDGYQGWREAAPFDGIIVTAAPPEVPKPLLDQLAVGGNLVVPVGDSWQDLKVYTKQKDGSFHQRKVLPVRFVPMTGEAQKNGRGR
ncbi:MAG TPA: protein-L-isoaspartate(D-aspartate) O-methyltransferase [Thermoanaerobaculia bacterium]|jgi:protein-L-isoaspartate(D-aspartate) O-methyltransferase|nr:protein-L-isoaspartate(D-aspartate) O-methyltransferase [Thermoanaerobaculia bacterium]